MRFLFISLFSILTACAGSGVKSSKSLFPEPTRSDRRAMQIRQQNEKEQAIKDRKMILNAKAKLAGFSVVYSDQSVSAYPQKQGAMWGASSENNFDQMRESDLFSELISRYEMNDYLGFGIRYEKFVAKYQVSDLIPEAHYMYGMLAHSAGLYGKALQKFNLLIKKHPMSKKLPQALLAKGITLKKLHLKAKAKETLIMVRNKYSHLPEGIRAAAELDLL